ncbi:MAG: hypothetical protein P8Z71_03425 [Candidatus Sulfobium sp.]|jgi:hypothetical protein
MNTGQNLIELDLSLVSPDVISVLIEDASDPGIFGEIARANTARPDVLKLLLDCTGTPDEVRELIAGTMKLPVVPKAQAPDSERTRDSRTETLLQRIQKLNVSARVQLALKGGREIRGILARDPNKEVVLGVLENGKITESEIELIAKNRSALEESLRRISKNREWMKKYSIVFALVTNPKTPAGIAVTFVSSLKKKDLSALEKNRNVSEAVRIAAKKLLAARRPG